MCILADSFRHQNLLILTLFLLSLLGFLTLILLYLVYTNIEVRKIFSLIQLDLKFLLIVGLINYTISSLNSMLFFGYQFIILLINLPMCSYITDGRFCFYVQNPFAGICPLICLFLFFAVFVERCYVSFGLKSNGAFGLILSIFIVTFPISLQCALFNSKSYVNERVFCASAFTTFDPNVVSGAYVSVIFDFIISLFDFFLLLFNKRRIQAHKKHRGFNLNKSFNLKSIKMSIEFIYPISLINAIAFAFQTVVYICYTKYAGSMLITNGVMMFEISNLVSIDLLDDCI
jgi:hypothetical protein